LLQDCQPLFVNQIELPEVEAAGAEKWQNGEFSVLSMLSRYSNSSNLACISVKPGQTLSVLHEEDSVGYDSQLQENRESNSKRD